MQLLRRYRATGADLPWGDPRRSHPGVAMEGYFWRLTDAAAGRSLIALVGVNQGPAGSWATLGLAGSNGFLRTAEVDGAWADAREAAAGSGARFLGDGRRLCVDLDEEARVDVVLSDLLPWPRSRPFGGSSIFQCVPGLNQYWHPWLLGGRADGVATLGGERWEIAGAQVYAEKNWGREGFPDAWWWGQAQGFAEPGACVAFAGGEVYAGGLRTEVTGLVVRLPDGTVVRLGDPVVTPVAAEVSDERWFLHGRGLGWQVDVDARAPLGDAHVLPVPLPSQRRNTPGALEHLSGRLRVRVRRFGRTVWEGESALAGLEHGGLARAEAELARRGGDPSPR